MYWGNMGPSPVLRLRQIHTFERSSPLPIIPNPNYWTLGHVYKPEFPTRTCDVGKLGIIIWWRPLGFLDAAFVVVVGFPVFFFFLEFQPYEKLGKAFEILIILTSLAFLDPMKRRIRELHLENIFLENLQILWILRIPINEYGIYDWNSGIFRDSEFLSEVLSMQLCWWEYILHWYKYVANSEP